MRGCLTFSLFFFLIMARVLFTFRSAGSHVTRVLSTVGMNALHSALTLFNFCQIIVYVWLGGLTCGWRLVYFWLG